MDKLTPLTATDDSQWQAETLAELWREDQSEDENVVLLWVLK